MTQKFDSTVDELINATCEAREVIREMHGATRDLRQAIREARRVISDELGDTEAKVSAEIRQCVDAELGTLSREVRQAMDKSVARVHKEFARLAAFTAIEASEEARQNGEIPSV